MKIEVYAEGPPRTGKSFILKRISDELKAYGFKLMMSGNVKSDIEMLTMTRDEDRSHYISGDRKLIFDNWEFELNDKGNLMKVIHAGSVINTDEVGIRLFAQSLMEVELTAVLKKVSP